MKQAVAGCRSSLPQICQMETRGRETRLGRTWEQEAAQPVEWRCRLRTLLSHGRKYSFTHSETAASHFCIDHNHHTAKQRCTSSDSHDVFFFLSVTGTNQSQTYSRIFPGSLSGLFISAPLWCSHCLTRHCRWTEKDSVAFAEPVYGCQTEAWLVLCCRQLYSKFI